MLQGLGNSGERNNFWGGIRLLRQSGERKIFFGKFFQFVGSCPRHWFLLAPKRKRRGRPKKKSNRPSHRVLQQLCCLQPYSADAGQPAAAAAGLRASEWLSEFNFVESLKFHNSDTDHFVLVHSPQRT